MTSYIYASVQKLSAIVRMRYIAAAVSMAVAGAVCATASHAFAYELVEGYYNPASAQIIPGMYVSRADDGVLVGATVTSNSSAAIGVAAEENSGLLTLVSKSSNVYVATSGTMPVFISDVAGPIADGDQLSASNIPGVLKKATDEDSYILGIARSSFSGAGTGVESTKTVEVQSSDGSKSRVILGTVSVDIKRYLNPGKTTKNPLQRAGERLVGKPVPMLQVIFGGIFFSLSMVTILALVSSGVRTSINAIGRNPLAKKSIMRGLRQIIGLALVVLVVGLAGSYIILWI